MNHLIQFLQSLIENPEIIRYVVPALLIIVVLGFLYNFVQQIKEHIGIIMVIAVIVYAIII